MNRCKTCGKQTDMIYCDTECSQLRMTDSKYRREVSHQVRSEGEVRETDKIGTRSVRLWEEDCALLALSGFSVKPGWHNVGDTTPRIVERDEDAYRDKKNGERKEDTYVNLKYYRAFGGNF